MAHVPAKYNSHFFKNRPLLLVETLMHCVWCVVKRLCMYPICLPMPLKPLLFVPYQTYGLKTLINFQLAPALSRVACCVVSVPNGKNRDLVVYPNSMAFSPLVPLPASAMTWALFGSGVSHCAETWIPPCYWIPPKTSNSKMKVWDYKRGYPKWPKNYGKPRKFWTLSVHPDRETVGFTFRMSSCVIFQSQVTAGMLITRFGNRRNTFLQIANQSLNVAINTKHLNKSHPLTTRYRYQLYLGRGCFMFCCLDSMFRS